MKTKFFGRSALLAVSLAVVTMTLALPSHALGRRDGHNYDAAPVPSPVAQVINWLFGAK